MRNFSVGQGHNSKVMKKLAFLLILLFSQMGVSKQLAETDTAVLVGKWKLDMSPQDKTDSNFAMMDITKVEGNTLNGEFYRKGVKIRNGQINTQLGVVYGALISNDNSGTYDTTFFYKDGLLHGTTHSIDRNFLAVWEATRIDS